METSQKIHGAIIAGGAGRRMSIGDKPLLRLGDRSLIEHVIRLAAPQVDSLVIVANQQAERFAHLGLPVMADRLAAGHGPLAGIHRALMWLHDKPESGGHLACFPADVPWFPRDLVSHLAQALRNARADVAWCVSDGQVQPLFSLWSTRLLPEIGDALGRDINGPMPFFHTLGRRAIAVETARSQPADFLNINTPGDLAAALQHVEPAHQSGQV